MGKPQQENRKSADQAAITIIPYDARIPAHHERFASLNREWLETYFFVEEEDAATFRDPKGRILDKDGVILMAEADDEIVGTGSLLKMEPSGYEIAKMAVTPAYQGRGIGEAIMNMLIASARAKGARQVFIVSNTKLTRAIQLYRKHGFVDSRESRHGHYARGNITLELVLS